MVFVLSISISAPLPELLFLFVWCRFVLDLEHVAAAAVLEGSVVLTDCLRSTRRAFRARSQAWRQPVRQCETASVSCFFMLRLIVAAW